MWKSCERYAASGVEKLLALCGGPPFVQAGWRQLAVVNYAVDPGRLAPFVPRGTELDSFEGRTYLSVVGFLFEDVRVLGVPVSRRFEEVNHRFYVRREDDRGVLRGVTFLRELVPRPDVTWIARAFYNEKYVTASMSHRLGDEVSYAWRLGEDEGELTLGSVGPFREAAPGSVEEFITEHYWGYGTARDGSTLEYRVEHPRWRVAAAGTSRVRGAFGSDWLQSPVSAFLAEGSKVRVFWPRLLGSR